MQDTKATIISSIVNYINIAVALGLLVYINPPKLLCGHRGRPYYVIIILLLIFLCSIGVVAIVSFYERPEHPLSEDHEAIQLASSSIGLIYSLVILGFMIKCRKVHVVVYLIPLIYFSFSAASLSLISRR